MRIGSLQARAVTAAVALIVAVLAFWLGAQVGGPGTEQVRPLAEPGPRPTVKTLDRLPAPPPLDAVGNQ
ncbi:MAG: hypothetical protein ACR2NA_05415 [Solirubrobacterales bacterium]